MIVSYFDPPAGAGKTYTGIQQSIKLALLGEKILWAMPTSILINSTMTQYMSNPKFKELHKNGLVFAVHTDTNPREVNKTIIEQLYAAKPGTIMFITHKALLAMQLSLALRQSWHLIVDEVFTPTYHESFPFNSEHHQEIIDAFQLDKTQIGTGFTKVKTNNRTKEIHTNKNHDSYWQILRDATDKINSDHYTVCVNNVEYDKFYNKELDENKMYIKFYGFAIPSIIEGFKSIVIMGADFNTSHLYKFWSNHLGVVFEKSKWIAKQEFNHCDKLTVNYVLKQNWSAKIKNTPIIKNEIKSTYDYVIDTYKEVLGDTQHLVVQNLDESKKVDPRITGILLPVMAHGLNNYMHIDNIAFLPALNPNPTYDNFLKSVCGLTANEIHDAMTGSIAYQCIMRTSMRDPTSITEKSVLVVDRRTAYQLLTRYFGGTSEIKQARVKHVGELAPKLSDMNVGGRPSSGKSTDELNRGRRKRYYEKQKIAKLQKNQNLMISMADSYDNSINVLNELSYENRIISEQVTTEIHTPTPTPTYLNLFLYKNINTGISHKQFISTNANFVDWLNKRSKMTYANKETNELVGGFTTITTSNRRRSDITQIHSLWLDNDGDGITYQDFADLFPQFEMHIYNTYSSGKNGIRKWRAYIPLKQLISIDQYWQLINVIYSKLPKKTSGKNMIDGFDTSKFRPESIFYLPCQSGFNDSFTAHYNRTELDVKPFISEVGSNIPQVFTNAAVEAQLTPQQIQLFKQNLSNNYSDLSSTQRQSRITTLIAEYTASKAAEGNHEFWLLSKRLRNRIGITDLFEARQLLEQAALSRHNSTERLKEINGLIKSWWQY